MHYVYVLKSKKDGRWYVGSTANVEKRLEQHNKGLVRMTAARRPFELVFSEAYADKRAAFTAEHTYMTARGKKKLAEKIEAKKGEER